MSMGSSKPEVSEFGSVDPAPPNSSGGFEAWVSVLHDESEPMFQRMRSVFSLRNHGGPRAIDALSKALVTPSALLKHEIAYVMGQMQEPSARPHLERMLQDTKEHVMVRHEAAEALGAIGAHESRSILEAHLRDPNPEVSESCEVALDHLAWVESRRFD